MRALVQRVLNTQVYEGLSLEQQILNIEKGMLLLIAVGPEDTKNTINQMAQKVVSLRIFPDEGGKTNLNCLNYGGKFLITSQFTLYADCKQGNRPCFTKALNKEAAKPLYEHFVSSLSALAGKEHVLHTPFGSLLNIQLVNSGPFTLWLDSDALF